MPLVDINRPKAYGGRVASTLEEWLESLPPITNPTALSVALAVTHAHKQRVEPSLDDLPPMPAALPS